MKKRNKILIIFTFIIVIVLVSATYSFVEFTTANFPKVLYARSYIKDNKVYDMGNGKYMIFREHGIEESYVQFVDIIGGDNLKKVDNGVVPYWTLRFNGDTVRIDCLVDSGIQYGYMIVEIKRESMY